MQKLCQNQLTSFAVNKLIYSSSSLWDKCCLKAFSIVSYFYHLVGYFKTNAVNNV